MTTFPSEIVDVIEGKSAWSIVTADCRDVLRALDALDLKVAHTIADPPYEAEAHTQQRRVKRGEVLSLEPLAFPPMTSWERDEVGHFIARLTRRWSLTFCQVEAAQDWRRAIVRGGATYRRTCIWVKPDGQPQMSGDRPGMGYETIVACHAPGRSTWNGGGRTGVFVHNKYEHATGHRNVHPTQKPVALMKELVELFTEPGEVVLDAYAGSGTTGIACLRHGRRFIGIEKDAHSAEVARERLRAEERGSNIYHARASQLALLDIGSASRGAEKQAEE